MLAQFSVMGPWIAHHCTNNKMDSVPALQQKPRPQGLNPSTRWPRFTASARKRLSCGQMKQHGGRQTRSSIGSHLS